MIRMQHPTIIKFYGFSLTDFEGKDLVTLLLQCAKNSSLAEILKKVRNGLIYQIYDNTSCSKIYDNNCYHCPWNNVFTQAQCYSPRHQTTQYFT
ncbi:hypothetical protein M9Y10_002737 [Tritrichomonas musculus]|uniref:Protein kinase domain-containing protein n=1 Tax=Tritrichomonas musculus TaxID=1915356 RepID=A0ABR2LCW3_9EUKA